MDWFCSSFNVLRYYLCFPLARSLLHYLYLLDFLCFLLHSHSVLSPSFCSLLSLFILESDLQTFAATPLHAVDYTSAMHRADEEENEDVFDI